MKRVVRAVVLLSFVIVAAASVRADSTPKIQGVVSGLELCPQAWCGIAIFTGVFQGQVGFNPNAIGLITVGVNHEDLPLITNQCADITDGSWVLRVGLRRFSGSTTGLLCYNGDNTWDVHVTMDFESGGTGSTTFHGTLDHNVFPPTIQGVIVQ
jgi:hypothetical protein